MYSMSKSSKLPTKLYEDCVPNSLEDKDMLKEFNSNIGIT